MGEQNIQPEFDGHQLRQFTQCLLDDVQALEQMLTSEFFERGIRRIGAEQELFLVDSAWRPSPGNLKVLESLPPAYFTHELGRFNIEINLDPLTFGGSCLSQLESDINRLMATVRQAAHEHDSAVVMTGILPSLVQADLSLDNMTPMARYSTLNKVLNRLRGGHYDFDIHGLDHLVISHDSVMFEACNTSFQVHFQTSPEEFARFYNFAQAASGPVLAAATNAPLLFGKRLWSETRIALFQQSIDTRSATEHRREKPPRVTFGSRWLKESVLEIFREDIARFKVLFGVEGHENPFEAMAAGRAPSLRALQLHNGTVYRWNRACYGLSSPEKAHLRIEARFLPSGPSVIDEVANSAFWFGALSGLTEKYDDISDVLDFEAAKTNFFNAAVHGLRAQFTWVDGRTLPASQLILNELLPLAERGLEIAGIDKRDSDRYLGVIRARVESQRTGTQWFLKSLQSFGKQGTKGERMRSLVSASITRQELNTPVHEWSLATLEEAGEWSESYRKVNEYMATDLLTVNSAEPVALVANLMDWNNLRYVLVEDEDHRLVGLVSERSVLRYLVRNGPQDQPIPISEVMQVELVTCTPETTTLEAVELMRSHKIGCMPVVHDGKLVGQVVESDFLSIARDLIEERLGGPKK